MWEVGAGFGGVVAVTLLAGPAPRSMSMVDGDRVKVIIDFFEARLAAADRFGLRHRCILDPGTGFAPPNWPWADRYVYQKRVYTRLDELRRFELPLYIALPWERTEQHDELLEIVVRQQPEFGRAHDPRRVRDVERALGIAVFDGQT